MGPHLKGTGPEEACDTPSSAPTTPVPSLQAFAGEKRVLQGLGNRSVSSQLHKVSCATGIFLHRGSQVLGLSSEWMLQEGLMCAHMCVCVFTHAYIWYAHVHPCWHACAHGMPLRVSMCVRPMASGSGYFRAGWEGAECRVLPRGRTAGSVHLRLDSNAWQHLCFNRGNTWPRACVHAGQRLPAPQAQPSSLFAQRYCVQAVLHASQQTFHVHYLV